MVSNFREKVKMLFTRRRKLAILLPIFTTIALLGSLAPSNIVTVDTSGKVTSIMGITITPEGQLSIQSDIALAAQIEETNLYKIDEFTGEPTSSSYFLNIAFNSHIQHSATSATFYGNYDSNEKEYYIEYYDDWAAWDAPPIETVNYTYAGVDRWHIVRLDTAVQAGQTYKVRCWLDIPFTGLETFTTKYVFGGKPQAETIQQAVQSGHAYLLDPWLSGGWDKRVKLTIDNTDIDATLTWFPVLVHLGTSVGRNSDDVSCIFDELTDDANRKKIAVTKADGETELYVSIEKWDDANEQAWLWVSRDGWETASDADTDLYLYYDVDHADNTTYVGDTNDEVAENVWDASFISVHHMADGADTSHIYDSTSNDFDGTKKGANEPIVTSGKIGNAQDFEKATDDYITMGNQPEYNLDTLTAEAWIYAESFENPGYNHIINKLGEWCLSVHDGKVAIALAGALGGTWWYPATTGVNTGTWYHVVLWYDGSDAKIFIDGSEAATTEASGAVTNFDDILTIACDADTYTFDGIIDDVRISTGGRPAAWLKATYETGRDDLLDFGSEETSAAFDPTTANKIKFTIDHNDIDSALENFPVLIYLSALSGINNYDLTGVFDDLTSDDNRKKIAVTTDDGETQCYVEIERWDDANEVAWIWFKAPAIAADVDTEFYFCYDSGQDDNTDYVGDTNAEVAENVWDANFILVDHMADGADTSHTRDSTDSDLDGTKGGAAAPAVTTSGKIANAQDFDGDDYVSVGAVSDLVFPQNTGIFTIESWIKLDNNTADALQVMIGSAAATANKGFFFGYEHRTGVGNNQLRLALYKGASGDPVISSFSSEDVVTDNNFHHVVAVGDGTNVTFYIDSGSDAGSDTMDETKSSGDASYTVNYGRYNGGTPGGYLSGLIDEIRIHDTNRAAAWLKATYETGRDDLIDFGVICSEDISNTPGSENLGNVQASSTYYAYGSAPSNPVEDGECTFTITNSSGDAVDLTMKATNFTGGNGWALTGDSPGEDTVRLTAYYSGQNPASGVVLTTSYQTFKEGVADSATLKWDFKLETGTFTDGVQKSSTITVLATCQ